MNIGQHPIVLSLVAVSIWMGSPNARATEAPTMGEVLSVSGSCSISTPIRVTTAAEKGLSLAIGDWLRCTSGSQIHFRPPRSSAEQSLTGPASVMMVQAPVFRTLPSTTRGGAISRVFSSDTKFASGDPIRSDVPSGAVVGGLLGGILGRGAGLFRRGQETCDQDSPSSTCKSNDGAVLAGAALGALIPRGQDAEDARVHAIILRAKLATSPASKPSSAPETDLQSPDLYRREALQALPYGVGWARPQPPAAARPATPGRAPTRPWAASPPAGPAQPTKPRSSLIEHIDTQPLPRASCEFPIADVTVDRPRDESVVWEARELSAGALSDELVPELARTGCYRLIGTEERPWQRAVDDALPMFRIRATVVVGPAASPAHDATLTPTPAVAKLRAFEMDGTPLEVAAVGIARKASNTTATSRVSELINASQATPAASLDGADARDIALAAIDATRWLTWTLVRFVSRPQTAPVPQPASPAGSSP